MINNCVRISPALMPFINSHNTTTTTTHHNGGSSSAAYLAATPYGRTATPTPTPTPAPLKTSAPTGSYGLDPKTPASARNGPPPPLSLGPSAAVVQDGEGAPGQLAQRLGGDFAVARASLRKASGIRVLLSLLQPQRSNAFDAAHADQVRALAVAALLGLAQDESIRQILTKLQVRG